MKNNQPNSPKSFRQDKGKDTYFQAQRKKIFVSLYKQPKTMLMVSVETGIMRSNITWFIREWRKRDCIKIVRKDICPISKRGGVQYLSTNPELFPAIVESSKPKDNG